MKICLVTLHAITNYGGVLQAYATQKSLENFGEVKILNYRNKLCSFKNCKKNSTYFGSLAKFIKV